MNFSKILLYCGLGYIGFRIFSNIQQNVNETVNSLVITPNGIKADLSNPLNPRLTISAIFANPALFQITVNSFFATVTIPDGTIIGTINLNTPTVIFPSSQQAITFPISLNGLNVVTDLITGNLNYNTIKVEGYYLVNNVKVPYTQTITNQLF